MRLLTGNQVGSLLAWYRIKTLFDKAVLNQQNAERGVIIKTFVTTDLQNAIADHYGVRCVETLTGFKYIGAKLAKYEREIPEQLRRSYADLAENETRRLRLAYSSLYVYGGEESYGYSGAEGANKIASLMESYAADPVREILGSRVANIRNFDADEIRDIEGDLIPKTKMLMFKLEDETRIAVRPSGTEPKIKYYLFAQRQPENEKFAQKDLEQIKADVGKQLNDLWDWLQKDADLRLQAKPGAAGQ